MKVEIKETEPKKEREFPRLMISDLGQIILAHGMNDDYIMGVLIISNGYPIGRNYSENWCNRSFKDFEGSITLSND